MTDTQTTTLSQWLLEQIEDDATVARKHVRSDGEWARIARPALASVRADDRINNDVATGLYVAAMSDPARVLADCEAHRKLVAMHETATDGSHCLCQLEIRDGGNGPYGVTFDGPGPCPTLSLLALPFADRPGYQESWRP